MHSNPEQTSGFPGKYVIFVLGSSITILISSGNIYKMSTICQTEVGPCPETFLIIMAGCVWVWVCVWWGGCMGRRDSSGI